MDFLSKTPRSSCFEFLPRDDLGVIGLFQLGRMPFPEFESIPLDKVCGNTVQLDFKVVVSEVQNVGERSTPQ